MDHGIELAYIGLEIPDPSTLDVLFGEVVGLVAGTPTTSGASTWRDDDRAQRIIVEAGEANDARYLGFEVAADAFDAAVEQVRAAGFAISEASADDAAERRVERLARTTSPWGVEVELVTGLERVEPFASPAMPGGFLTEGVGFGHTVFATTNFDEADRFVTEALGMGQSDWLDMEIMEGVELHVRFYHCNERHHSVALARPPFDLPRASGLAIANNLGRHDNDAMFSFYVVSPAGFQVEVGHGARLITPNWDDNRAYDRMSRWGHEPLPS